jgi:O-antigen/teichoic acid export membrane protein
MRAVKKIKSLLEKKGLIKTNSQSKTQTVVLNVTYSVLIKGVNVLLTFLSVPLLLNYLDSVQYGVWITILTFTSWFTLFDLGLGNGLKNKLIEFITDGQMETAKKHVSTTFITMGAICCGVSVMFFFLSHFLPWKTIFNIPEQLAKQVGLVTVIMLAFTMAAMFLKLIYNLLHAHQQSYKVDAINFVSQLAGFFSLVFAKVYLKSSLLTVAFLYSSSQLLALVIANIYFFQGLYRHLMPSFKNYERILVKEVVSMGGLFFLIQVAGLVMYMTDNFIISTLFGPQQVTIYNLALKYFSVLSVAWGLLLVPIWPMVTKAYYSDDLNWIKQTVKNLLKLLMVTIAGGVGIYIFSNIFYKIWIGTAVSVPSSVNLTMLIYTLVSVFATMLSTIINGMGKIKMQAYITVILAILNIPMAILFSRILHWGVIGIPIATTVCLTISSVFALIQSKKLLNKGAKGLWAH